jgi:hypothetical protein
VTASQIQALAAEAGALAPPAVGHAAEGERLHRGIVFELGKVWAAQLGVAARRRQALCRRRRVRGRQRRFEGPPRGVTLQAVSVHIYTPTEAAEHVQAESAVGLSPEHCRALEVLAAERLAEIAAQHPRLSELSGQMVERDPAFARVVAARRAENRISVVHLPEDFAAAPLLEFLRKVTGVTARRGE